MIAIPQTTLATAIPARGFSGDAYLAREDTFEVSLAQFLEGVQLTAGQETAVVVDVDKLSPNANVTNITATFTVVNDGSTAGAQTTSVGVNITAGAEGTGKRAFDVSVDAAGIRNVQVRLNQGSVFWTYPGLAAPGTYQIPDFSQQANAYLDKYKSQDGKVKLQFQVKSDVAGKVQIEINGDLASSMLQTQSWPNPLDSTFRVDRTLSVGFNQIETLPIDPVSPPAGKQAAVKTVRLDAGGQFGADRLLGPVEVHDGRQFATVSSDFSVAQALQFAKSILKTSVQASGIAGYFEASDKAEFYVELQSDDSGSPANATPLAKANVSFVPADTGSPQPWTFAKFEKPVELKPDTPYWVIAKGVRGAVHLGVKISMAVAPGAAVARGGLLLNRGGLVWKNFAGSTSPPLESLLSLVYLPQPDNQTSAVAISVGNGAPQQIDPKTPARTVTFDLSAGLSGPPTLIIDSRAAGSLIIANVVQEYSLS
jgi:hypothetical protein